MNSEMDCETGVNGLVLDLKKNPTIKVGLYDMGTDYNGKNNGKFISIGFNVSKKYYEQVKSFKTDFLNHLKNNEVYWFIKNDYSTLVGFQEFILNKNELDIESEKMFTNLASLIENMGVKNIKKISYNLKLLNQKEIDMWLELDKKNLSYLILNASLLNDDNCVVKAELGIYPGKKFNKN
ncbi:MAG: hypothetical protein GON13_03190, partial [Nanoarchaeota archaeon]|nr:hypothetical protein [Nanoarchaeota archaeon]